MKQAEKYQEKEPPNLQPTNVKVQRATIKMQLKKTFRNYIFRTFEAGQPRKMQYVRFNHAALPARRQRNNGTL